MRPIPIECDFLLFITENDNILRFLIEHSADANVSKAEFALILAIRNGIHENCAISIEF